MTSTNRFIDPKTRLTSTSSNNTTESTFLGDLDDIRDGTVYAKILTTDISAGHVKLSEVTGTLDDVDNGTTYVRVLATDISSGHLKLTSNTAVNGNWYDSSGVSIDATTGINIYGTDGALTTRATKTGTIQCKVDTTGAIVAGAGNVRMDADGITAIGAARIRFYEDSTTIAGSIGYESGNVTLKTSISHPLTVASFGGTLTLHSSGVVSINGSSVSVNSKKITSLATPSADTDAATKKYVDDSIPSPFSGNLSDLTINADKDWNAKAITNMTDLSLTSAVKLYNGATQVGSISGTTLLGVTVTSLSTYPILLSTTNADIELSATASVIIGAKMKIPVGANLYV